MAVLDVEVLADEMEQAGKEERENKFKELFPRAKVTITNIGEEYSSTFTYTNYKYKVTISNEGKRMQITFHDSVANYNKGAEPTLLDVLYSAVSDAECYKGARSAEDFCSELGYESIAQGTKIYRACEKRYDDIIKVFGEKGYELLGAIVRGY